jgi:hypothetical protein
MVQVKISIQFSRRTIVFRGDLMAYPRKRYLFRIFTVMALALLISISQEVRAIEHLSQDRLEEKDGCANYRTVQMPKYKVEKRERGDLATSLALYVSVKKTDIAKDRVVSLACYLGQLNSMEPNIVVWIFDDANAARAYSPQGEGNSRRLLSSLIAVYGFSKNVAHSYHSVTWYDIPGERGSKIQIDLGKPPTAPKS